MGPEVNQLLLASLQAAKESNEVDLEYVLRMLYVDHENATRIQNLLKAEKSMTKPQKISRLMGLTYLLDNGLTAAQYTSTRLISKEHGSNIFPSYNKVAKAKEECRPPEKCKVTGVSATLPLQALLDHTAHRILLLQEPILMRFKMRIKLQIKWGCDGSSDHSRYNQNYVHVETAVNSDANFFATTVAPLRMTSVDDAKTLIWNNAAPQSPRWCRPRRFNFAKEMEEFTLREINFVQTEIAALNIFTVTIAGVQVSVEYELYFTMLDGKTLATVTGTKSKQTCCVCKATPKQFNNLENKEIRFKPKEGTLCYGLSVLHLWIRFFEWLLHLSYRVDIKKWQLRDARDKEKAKERKHLLQQKFLDEMKLRVDFPSTKGTGNSNTGNVCRKAFSDPKTLLKILGVNEKLVKNVRIILIALSSQLPLDIDRFQEFCDETSERYVGLYKWFPFPP